MHRDLETRIFTPILSPEHQKEQEALDRFIGYMNQKAVSIGMTQSHFNDAAGMHNIATARDLLKLIIYADQHPVFHSIWSQDTYTITVGGSNPRTKQCFTKSFHPDLNDHYHVLGKKGGSLMSSARKLFVYNLSTILEIPNSADRLAVVTMYAPEGNNLPNNRFNATRQVADIALTKYRNPDADITDMPVCCENAIAALIPSASSADMQILYEKDADTLGRPMSISKVLTAACVLDIIKDLGQSITYHDLDTNIGGFYVKDFIPGDTMTYLDALHAMILESSNVTAQALARSVGQLLTK